MWGEQRGRALSRCKELDEEYEDRAGWTELDREEKKQSIVGGLRAAVAARGAFGNGDIDDDCNDGNRSH